MISSILLAAGQSKRMNGENKLIKKIDGIPLIKHSVKNIINSSIDELIIVLGYEENILRKIIGKNNKIKYVFNKNFESGISSSIKIGINNLSFKTQAFFISLGDMPLISQKIYNLLIKHMNDKQIIVPVYKGSRGNPILFSKSMIDEIMNIQGDVGAKNILSKNENKILNVNVGDKSILQDFDTIKSFIS